VAKAANINPNTLANMTKVNCRTNGVVHHPQQ
jgi:hypothetical protein